MVKYTVFIPAYNEENTTAEVIESSFRALKSYDAEVIFVDDGSTDHTGKIAEELKKRYKSLKVMHHGRNKGLTECFITCFNHFKGEIIIFLPADLESNPEEDIPKLINKLKDGYELVIGWRQNRKGSKKFSSYMYNSLSRMLFNLKLHDSNWIKIFTRDVIKDLNLRSGWHRYIPMIAKAQGYKIGEVRVRSYKRRYGKSKFGTARLLTGILDLLVVKFHLSFIEKPMLVFGSLGLLSLTFGVLGGVYLTIIRIMTGSLANRLPFLILVLLLMIFGLLLFAIGFLAELLVTVIKEVNKKR